MERETREGDKGSKEKMGEKCRREKEKMREKETRLSRLATGKGFLSVFSSKSTGKRLERVI